MTGFALIVAVLAIVAAGVSASQIPARKVFVREPECRSSGIDWLPHSKDCTLYYVCQDGKSTIRTCPEGLYFNYAIKQCDWPPAGCFPGMSRPETQPSIPDEEEPNTPGCIGTCPSTDPLDRTIHLPYGGDCTKFCKCSNGTPFLMDCPGGLHFDRVKSICNWPKQAKCQW